MPFKIPINLENLLHQWNYAERSYFCGLPPRA